MAKKEKSKIVRYVLIIVVVLIVLESLSFLAIKNLPNKTEEIQEDTRESFITGGNSTIIRMKIPAVDADGKGVATILQVEAIRGNGRTLTDIENLLFWADTQQSIRMAKLVAGNITGINLNNYDLIYSIEANASLIGGPSAGAALAIATIFALKGEKFNENAMISGTINHDGSIGPVSAILEKAKASKEANATIFLVPLLQSRDVTYETKQHCQKFGYSEICQEESIPRKINVSEEAGISVIEVASIEEALRYFS